MNWIKGAWGILTTALVALVWYFRGETKKHKEMSRRLQEALKRKSVGEVILKGEVTKHENLDINQSADSFIKSE